MSYLGPIVALASILGGALDAGADAPKTQLSLEPRYIGGAVSVARRIGPSLWVGGELGVGPDVWSSVVVGGAHFTDDAGPAIAYATPDGATNKELVELAHVEAFLRHEPTGWLQLDGGVHASMFFHFDSTDDDPAEGWFGAGFVDAMFGWRYVKVGPRIMFGVASDRPATEFVVFVVPLSVRVTFAF
jgi:hypothetical protein